MCCIALRSICDSLMSMTHSHQITETVYCYNAGCFLVKFESFAAGAMRYRSLREHITYQVSRYSSIGLVSLFFPPVVVFHVNDYEL